MKKLTHEDPGETSLPTTYAKGRKAASDLGGGQPYPLYQQVKRFILKHIESGQWPANHRIPSENELVATLGVSRMTANRALRELTGDGLLIRIQGVGTFVAPRKPQSTLLEIKSIAEEIKSAGAVHSSDVILLEEEEADQETAVAMDINPGDPVYHSILVHRSNGLAIQFADRYVNPELAPRYLEQDFTRVNPSQYLTGVTPVSELEHIVEATLPDATMQELLEIGPTEPCLVLYRRTWSGDKVATKGCFVHPGSRYRLGSRFKPQPASENLV